VRKHRSEFESRSALYSRLDEQFCDRTRFFAAAALINSIFARLLEFFPAVRRSRSFTFITEVGAALEIANLQYAGEINKQSPSRQTLDHALVCAEQRLLQFYVQAHQAQRPHHWESIRRELNALLNDRYAASLLSPSFGNRCFARVLQEVRAHMGTALDFATESHRIRIGVRLIEHIREQVLPSPAKPV
jgi:hypothetical protein